MFEMDKVQNSDDMVDIGETHHKAGRLQEAESCYRRALELDPGHPGALYFLANIAYEDGRLLFSAQLAEELLREEPNDAEAWHLLGVVALKEGSVARASECFEKALVIQPAYAQAHYSLSNLLIKQGDIDAALEHLQRAVALNPAFAEAHYSIGTAFQAQDKMEEALSSYRQAINVKSDFGLPYEGIGGILLSQGKTDEAIANYRKAIAGNVGSASIHAGLGTALLLKDQIDAAAVSLQHAIALDPHCCLAHYNRGNVFYKQSKFREAANSFQLALVLSPQDTRLLANLAKAYYSLDEIDKAAEIYRQWLALEPDNPTARHHLAACTRDAIPERAGDAYVESTFDDFADSFDAKLGALQYRAPQLLAEALRRECGAAHKQFMVLDAGCGTGLCGPFLVEYSAQLIGVDLSAGMLEKAKIRNAYDALIKAELTAYLQSQINVFDVILSADTLVYFGALDSILTAARSAIRAGGHLFFTLEEFTGENKSEVDYFLNPHGRYSHNDAYVQSTLSKAGFTIVAIDNAVLRNESNRPVKGFVVSCRAD